MADIPAQQPTDPRAVPPLAGQPIGPAIDETLVYRPVSGLALAGFVMGCLFATLLVLGGGLALSRGEPFFLWTWTLGLAALGAVVSFFARRQILNSEGTRAGLALSTWGLWLSGFLGLAYFIYLFVTGLAITSQAKDFLVNDEFEDTGVLTRIQKAGKDPQQLNRAFLLTLKLGDRANINPADDSRILRQFDEPSPEGSPGRLTMFRRHPLVIALSDAGDQAKVEVLGVMQWVYENGSYHVTRTMRITVPEATWELPVTVFSAEAIEAGEKRQWHLAFPGPFLTPTKTTPLGAGLATLRASAKKSIEKFLVDLDSGKAWKGFDAGDTEWDKILPRDKDALRQYVKQKFVHAFTSESAGRLKMMVEYQGGVTPWAQVDGRIQLTLPLKMYIDRTPDFPAVSVLGDFVVETTQPIDPANLGSVIPDWAVRKVRVFRAFPILAGHPGAG